MSGRRLLDALTFFNASRSVAGKHVVLRKQQLDVHLRTSSVTKGAKNQVDRAALAAQAASELAQKFNAPNTVNPQSGANSVGEQYGAGSEETTADANGKDSNDSRNQTTTHITSETRGINTKGSIHVPNSDKRPSPHASSAPQEDASKSHEKSDEGELPEAMVGQLFRSPKVAADLSMDSNYIPPKWQKYGAKGRKGDYRSTLARHEETFTEPSKGETIPSKNVGTTQVTSDQVSDTLTSAFPVSVNSPKYVLL